MSQNRRGLFISVEGPNAVGKGTYITALCNKLTNTGYSTHITKEPTATPLGMFCKTNEAKLSGLPYAILIAADRCLHIETEILPHINKGEIVLTDRYIESSFVFQKYEGVSYEKIWELNSDFPIPDLSILLLADHETIAQRLVERTKFSVFEMRMSRQEELEYYSQAKEFLSAKGFNYLVQYNNKMDQLEFNIELAAASILSLL